MRSLLALAAAGALTALPAAAHITLDPTSAAPGSYVRAALRVPHGCGGAATTRVSVELPEGVYSAKPMPKPGWTLAIERRRLDAPVQGRHGRVVEEEIGRISWEGGPLPDEQYDEFVLMLQAPNEPGGVLYLPVTQGCAGGASEAWVERPAAGQSPHDLARPAPALRLAALEIPAAAPATMAGMAHGAMGTADHAMHGMAPTPGPAPAPAATPVQAPAPQPAGIEVTSPWSRAAGQGGTGAGFFGLVNRGAAADRLVSASSPAARRVELHTHLREGEVMRMREVPGIELAPGQAVTLRPGGFHLMLIGLTRPLEVGQQVPVTLVFEKAGAVQVQLAVMGAGARGP